MKQISVTAAVFVVIMLLFTACDGFNPFIGNGFGDIDNPSYPSVGESSTEDLISAILTGSGFAESLSDEDLATLLAYLETEAANIDLTDLASITTADQELLYSLAMANLQSQGVDDSLNNVDILSLTSGEFDMQDPGSLSDTVFGADATTDEISTQLLAMVNSSGSFEDFGTTVDANGLPSSLENESTTLGTQVLVAGIVNSMVDDIIAQDPNLDASNPEDVAAATESLAAFMSGETTTAPASFDTTFLQLDANATAEEQEAALAASLGDGTAALLTETGMVDLLANFGGGA